MNLPQENFDRAIHSASETLVTLGSGRPPALEQESPQQLRAWLWDLDAIGAAIRLELMNRETSQPIDLG